MSKPRSDRLLQPICQLVVRASPLQNLVIYNCQGALQGELAAKEKDKRHMSHDVAGLWSSKIFESKGVVQLRSFEHGTEADL